MNLQQAKQQISQQLVKYLKEIQNQTISDFQMAKKRKKPSLPIQITKQQENIQQITFNIEDFKFDTKNIQKSWKDQLKEAQIKQKPLYHQQYGYCLKQITYDAIYERLLLLRKCLYKKRFPNQDLSLIEEFIQQGTLQKLAMNLPTEMIEIERIILDNSLTESFLKEIKYFIKTQQIDKSQIFYHPQMFEQIDKEIDLLLAEYEELERRRCDAFEESLLASPPKQLKF